MWILTGSRGRQPGISLTMKRKATHTEAGSPQEYAQNKEHFWPAKRVTMAATVFLGGATLCAGLYVFITQMVFALRASAHDGTIVEVRHEQVPRGRGSVLAYVPVVQVPSENGFVTIRVDTFSEEPIYKVGQQLSTLCDSASLRCIPNSFLAKWGDATVLFLLSFVFFMFAFKSWHM